MVKGYVPGAVEPVVVMVNVEEPAPLRLPGLNPALVFAGRVLNPRDTAPLKPLLVTRFTVNAPLPPGATVCEPGAAVRPKSPTTRLTVLVWETLPLVPTMVKGYVPGGVETEVEIERVELVEAALIVARLIEAGLNPPLAPEGNPLTVRLTVLLNPPSGATATGKMAPPPAGTVWNVVDGVTENSR